MLAGELYDALDPELVSLRRDCRARCAQLNATFGAPDGDRRAVLDALFGAPNDAWVEPPFYCDYGFNIGLGTGVFFNFNCVVLDVMPVTIGDCTLIGPAVQIYTATHPLDAATRSTRLEYAKPVVIGRDVWIGGAAVICPGVTIGDRVVVGAGAVVTKDVANDCVVAGNPARVIRRAT